MGRCAVLTIGQQGREPTQELRVAFEGGDEALFSALLDRLVKEYDDAKERKAAKSAKRAKVRNNILIFELHTDVA